MKAILFSSFGYMAEHFLPKLNINKAKLLKCLFISYALEDEGYINFSKRILKESFPNIEIIDLSKNYCFHDKIDVVFVNGGKTEDLIEKLIKYKQMEKLKKLIKEDNVLYIGESAGCVLFGDYSKSYLFTQLSEGNDISQTSVVCEYTGLKLIDKMIVPHFSKYRLRRIAGDNTVYRSLYGLKYNMIVKMIEILKLNHVEYETIANNEALLIDNDKIEKLEYDWSNMPIIDAELSKHEKELLEKTKKDS